MYHKVSIGLLQFQYTIFLTCLIQSDPTNSNWIFQFSVISNSEWFPLDFPSAIYYQLFQTPAISNYFLFPLRVWSSRV